MFNETKSAVGSDFNDQLNRLSSVWHEYNRLLDRFEDLINPLLAGCNLIEKLEKFWSTWPKQMSEATSNETKLSELQVSQKFCNSVPFFVGTSRRRKRIRRV
ncbi:unnamed protein product [Protopolystoma xenopodis]|uniref:Dynein heavy chain tail domain-containing protein n=1 Tax=Protopolystoma xenopodis TaxID=117903 RepID=A0A3S5C884_9PLAT|nr:unnamed protein product [Protopolystoma xenopodis]